MARTILRDLAIFSVVIFILMFALTTFAFDMFSAYSLDDDQTSRVQEWWNLSNNSLDKMHSRSSTFGSIVQEDPIVEETGSEFFLTRSIANSVKFITQIPGFLMTLITKMTGFLGIDPIYKTAFFTIVLLIATFTIVSLYFRKDA